MHRILLYMSATISLLQDEYTMNETIYKLYLSAALMSYLDICLTSHSGREKAVVKSEYIYIYIKGRKKDIFIHSY